MPDANKGKARVCYECGSPDHYARDCPIRQARIASGGPAILPEHMHKGKGGKGGKGSKGGKQPNAPTPTPTQPWPTQSAWTNMYPGPSPTQWKDWYPGAHPGKGGANVLEQLFAPGSAFSLTPNQPNAAMQPSAGSGGWSQPVGGFRSLTTIQSSQRRACAQPVKSVVPAKSLRLSMQMTLRRRMQMA